MKKLLLLGIYFLISVFFYTSVSQVFAANLSVASIRLDRHKSNTAPGSVLVMAKTGENVTESSVKITVPAAWTISGTVSNFGVSTTGLPSGVTAWPGIGSSASSVSGQSITFSSADIASGTTYGFYITGGIGNNPTVASQTQYQWSIATMVGASESSSSVAVVPVVTNDQIVITATVEPDSAYFTADLSSTTAGSTVNQETTINFQISYGSTYTNASPLTLQAEWEEGSLLDSPGSTVNVWEYVIGSATTGYGGTAPVVDLNARTITWTISSIPSNTTNQTVTFSLKTSDDYTGSSLVELPVSARITNPTSTSDTTVTHYYRYRAVVTATPNPTSVPGSGPTSTTVPGTPSVTPTLTPIATPTQTPAPSSSEIIQIQIPRITDTHVEVVVTLRNPSLIEMRYGVSPNALTSIISSEEELEQHRFSLTGLNPGTKYYFQFFTLNGNQPISEIFEVLTALEFPDGLQPEQLVLASEGIPLFQTINSNEERSVIVPHSVPGELTLFLNQEVLIDRAILFARNNKGQTLQLGQLTFSDPKVLSGKFLMPSENDEYELFVRLTTPFGALVEYPIVELIVVDPLRIFDKETHLPIEQVSVSVWQFNEARNLYFLLPAPSFLPRNPLFTDRNGEAHLALPTGKYKIELRAFGYVAREIDFSLRGERGDGFPQVELSAVGWNPIMLIQSYWKTVVFSIDEFFSNTEILWQSRALFNVASVSSMATLSIFTIVALQARTLVSAGNLLQHIAHRLGFKNIPLFGAIPSFDLAGRVLDHLTGQPIGQATVTAISKFTHQVLFKTTTSRAGMFHLPALKEEFMLQIESVGYKISEMKVDQLKKNLDVRLEQHTEFSHELSQSVKEAAVWGFGMLFESLLISSILAELIFMRYLGVAPVLPFVITSAMNSVIWGHYLFVHRFPV